MTKKQKNCWLTVYDLKQSLASHSRSPERMMQSRMISDAVLRNKQLRTQKSTLVLNFWPRL